MGGGKGRLERTVQLGALKFVHVARMGEKRDACRGLVGKPEGNTPRGRHSPRWVNLNFIL
jgi:hypothetical protein